MEIAMSQACPSPLRSIPADDAEAKVSQLYRENSAVVLRYVTKLLRDRYLAEDVVQETMLRAWRHCDELSTEQGSVRNWLIRVAHNIAIDKIRMRRSRPTEVAEDAMPDGILEDHADAVVTAVHLERILSQLSSGHRDVLEQVYLNGYTVRGAAKRLGIPEGTAFSRSHHALRILRQELGATVPEPARQAA
jgi:RNA polymerase sigma-70 factor (ECF subfamily)